MTQFRMISATACVLLLGNRQTDARRLTDIIMSKANYSFIYKYALCCVLGSARVRMRNEFFARLLTFDAERRSELFVDGISKVQIHFSDEFSIMAAEWC